MVRCNGGHREAEHAGVLVVDDETRLLWIAATGNSTGFAPADLTIGSRRVQ
jgi:hypothetical protein